MQRTENKDMTKILKTYKICYMKYIYYELCISVYDMYICMYTM